MMPFHPGHRADCQSVFRHALAAGLIAMAWTLGGCGSDISDPRGERVSVRGTVTLDGAPLSIGRIVFESTQGKGAVKATALVEDGSFALDESIGPLPGLARVSIYPVPIELEQVEAARQSGRRVALRPVDIPDRYSVRSKLTAEIGHDGEDNVLSFALTSR